MKGTGGRAPASSAILTVPNLLSFLRILLIPVFAYLIVHEGTELAGIALFGGVAATDWVDGYVARRTNQVSELGKILDPVADRLAIAAGLVAMMVRGAIPVWAGLAILVRDAAVLLAAAVVLTRRKVRVDVRYIGKTATFNLMAAITCISWGNLDLPLSATALAVGWVLYTVGIAEYYLAAAWYAGDLLRALAAPASPGTSPAPPHG
jgi:cardiolipin synthase